MTNETSNKVFAWCVEVLEIYAEKWGMTYEELNVWIFCIIEPIVFAIMFLWIWYLVLRTFSLSRIVKRQKRSIATLQGKLNTVVTGY